MNNKIKIKGFAIILMIIISSPSILSLNLDIIKKEEIITKININNIDPFDENISFLMKEAHTPGLSACIVINDTVVWEKGYGYANINKKINATENTIYLGASISKTITATAIMQLWEQGLFDLDDDVNNYLPFDLRNPKHSDKKITYRMLLSHHSSLAYGDLKTEPFIFLFFSLFSRSKERYEELLSPSGKLYNPNIWIDSEPGEALNYSNIGYFLLEYLVELISKQSFDEYCTTHIFNPLEMNNTSYQISNYEKNDISTPYIWALHSYIPLPNYEFMDYGVGGVRTSVKDLSHFLIANMNGGIYNGKQILNEETIELMRTVQFPDSNHNLWFQYGLGWRIMSRNDTYFLWHPGIGPGVATYINYNPVNKIGIIFFVNQYPIIGEYNIMAWINILYLLLEKAYSFV